MSSFPVALIFGVLGIVYDKRKLLAIITTIIAGGLVLYYMCMMGITMLLLCR